MNSSARFVAFLSPVAFAHAVRVVMFALLVWLTFGSPLSRLAILNDHIIDARVAAIGNDKLCITQLVILLAAMMG